MGGGGYERLEEAKRVYIHAAGMNPLTNLLRRAHTRLRTAHLGGTMSSPYHSQRERVAAVLIALSRVIPGSGVLLWLICGADIPTSVQLGRGVRFPHGARAVVIHPGCVIGDRCVINHSVTLGAEHGGAPVLEDEVRIGAGAVVLGPVTLGRGCRVGANAVVKCDVPAGALAVGVPAVPVVSDLVGVPSYEKSAPAARSRDEG